MAKHHIVIWRIGVTLNILGLAFILLNTNTSYQELPTSIRYIMYLSFFLMFLAIILRLIEKGKKQ